MRLLVTGITGFVGSELEKLLVSTDHEVIALVRSKPSVPHKRIKTIIGDLSDLGRMKSAAKTIGPVDRIIHLAAAVPKSSSDDTQRLYQANIHGTRNLLEAFGRGAKGIVLASTVEVYGCVAGGTILSGKTPPAPVSFYGRSKLASEKLFQAFGKKYSIPVSILRLTVLYGAGDTIDRAIPSFIKQALHGASPTVFGGEELRDYLHVADAAKALHLAIRVNPNGIFVIGSGSKTTVRQAAQTIINMVNPKLTLDIRPRRKPAYDLIIDIKPAKKLLGFTARYHFPDLLGEQIVWMKKRISS